MGIFSTGNVSGLLAKSSALEGVTGTLARDVAAQNQRLNEHATAVNALVKRANTVEEEVKSLRETIRNYMSAARKSVV